MTKALVTGAAGFIGSHLCELLLSHEHEVVGIDNFSNGSPENVQAVFSQHPNTYQFKNVDVTHSDSLESIFHFFKPELVFHQAALGSIPRSLKNPYWTLQNNIFGFHNILEMCRKHKVRRLVYASSSSVYGGNPRLMKAETEVADMLNPYALSKYVNEEQATTWWRAYGVESVGLRYFNVFGPRQNPYSEYSAVIAKWLGCIRSGEEIVLHGSGEQSRDFTYVDNVIYANMLASAAPLDCVNTVYNVGGGTTVRLAEILRKISQHAEGLGYTMPPVRRTEGRPGDVQGTCADLSRAQKRLGYRVKVDWKKGLEITCESVLRR